MIPDWMSFIITMNYNALHVVRKHMFWNAHTLKSMEHTNKEVFLFGIRKEFYISFTAMMANHCKTSNFIRTIIPCINVYKSPVHLITLASKTGVTAPAITLRCNSLPFRWNKIFMTVYISFDSS